MRLQTPYAILTIFDSEEIGNFQNRVLFIFIFFLGIFLEQGV